MTSRKLLSIIPLSLTGLSRQPDTHLECDKMTDEKKILTIATVENRYLAVIAASRRARQLLDRAEKHSLTVDTEKVVLQALNEFLIGKVTYVQPTGVIAHTPSSKKKSKEKD
jgi:DNA-directed RNA polymerase omega subunit